jgi:DNA-directed RNA polymerase alpha subunit
MTAKLLIQVNKDDFNDIRAAIEYLSQLEREVSWDNGFIYLRINEMNLNRRSFNFLKNNDIKTVGDLIKITPKELLKYPNCGNVIIQNIKDGLHKLASKYSYTGSIGSWKEDFRKEIKHEKIQMPE